jgi:plastocyanin
MMRKLVATSGILVVLLAGACGSNDSSDKTSNTTASSSSTSAPQRAMIGGVDAIIRGTSVAADDLEVEVDDNYFKPNVIVGTPGQAVTLELESEGNSTHNFSIPAQQIDTDIASSKKVEVKVTFPQSGEVAFFCKFHKDESGMVGALRVT